MQFKNFFKKIFSTIVISSIFVLPALSADKTKIDIEALLKKADFYRGDFTEGFSWNVKVTSVDEGEKQVREFKVLSKGNNSIAKAIAPERNKGEVYLFNDRVMWFFKPSLKKPLSISSRQRLSGQAANGDIATTQYARDYTPQFLTQEKFKNEDVVIMMLTSKDKNTTYDKIRYSISLKSERAVKAEFLSIQGNLLKTALFEYDNKMTFNGKTEYIVSKMIISDAFNKENVSELQYNFPEIVQVPDHTFNVNSLGR